MAIYHFKTTGTRETGASTADLWTEDANCYPTDHATNADLFSIFNSSLTDGDELILDDEIHTVDRFIASSQAVGSDITITMRGRSNDSTKCTLNMTTTLLIPFNLNPPAGNENSYIFKGFKLTGAAPHTAAGNPFISYGARCTEVTWDDVDMSDIDMVHAGGVGVRYIPLIGTAPFTGLGSRVTNFINPKFTRITGVFDNGSSLLMFDDVDSTVNFTGTTTITGCTSSAINTDNSTKGKSFGFFYFVGDVNVLGPVNVSDCTSTVTEATAQCWSVFYINGGATKTFTSTHRITGTNLTWTGGGANAALVTIDDTPYVIDEVVSDTVVSEANFSGVEGLGGNMLITRPNATGTIKLAKATDSKAFHGVALYFSQGAQGTVDRVISIDCTCYLGALYFGGDGQEIHCKMLLVKGLKEIAWASPASDSSCFFSHVNDDAGHTVNRSLRQFTFKDNYDNGTPEAYIKNNNAPNFACNFTLEGGVFGSSDYQLAFVRTATAALNITETNCAYETSKMTNVTANVYTQTGHINATLTTNVDGSLPDGSLGADAATGDASTVEYKLDANDEPYTRFDKSIGAFQSLGSKYHASNN